jgi:predicted ArsR family transcriptional regulator
VLDVLRSQARPLSILEIAEHLDVHPNTVRFHLLALVESGQVARAEADPIGPGRPPQLFQALRRMDPTGPRDYRLLSEVLATHLAAGPNATRRAIEAGRSWGREQGAAAPGRAGTRAAVDRLVGLLDDLGFAPEREGRGSADRPARIGLHNCPFLDLAADRPQIVCSIHLGLMRGALETWGAEVTVERLEPFAEPDLCRVHLTRRSAPQG